MLTLVVGSINQANKKYNRWWNTDWIIGQTIETDQEMLDKGRLFFAENNCDKNDHVVFCNVELFFMGLRLGILDGQPHDLIVVEYFPDNGNFHDPTIPAPAIVTFDENGRHSKMPGDMFNAQLNALRQLATTRRT